MPRGYTNVKFVGGPLDGHIEEMVIIKHLVKNYRVRSDKFFASEPNGGMSIRSGKLSSNWHSFSQDIYIRQKKPKHSGGEFTIYLFDRNIIIERCQAITKQGTQCTRSAREGTNHCSDLHQAKIGSQK